MGAWGHAGSRNGPQLSEFGVGDTIYAGPKFRGGQSPPRSNDACLSSADGSAEVLDAAPPGHTLAEAGGPGRLGPVRAALFARREVHPKAGSSLGWDGTQALEAIAESGRQSVRAGHGNLLFLGDIAV